MIAHDGTDGQGRIPPVPAPVPLPLALPRRSAHPSTHARLLRIPAGRVALEGALTRPRSPDGLVVVACASGTVRCARIRSLVRGLQTFNLATLVVDLLVPTEKISVLWAALPPEACALGDRLVDLTLSLQRAPAMRALPIAFLGIHTGAGAVLAAAAAIPDTVTSVVCLGCSTDGTQFMLADVCAPTLLLVGERDPEGLGAAERALSLMTNTRNLTVLPGVSHRFEQQDAIDRVVTIAGDWLQYYLRRARRAEGRAVDFHRQIVQLRG